MYELRFVCTLLVRSERGQQKTPEPRGSLVEHSVGDFVRFPATFRADTCA
ncbi:hypothetical protein ACFVYA_35210 [Amycolatopsis sp. NPDC058278]